MKRINQRLNGLNPLSYLGSDAQQPTNIKVTNRDPETSDLRNFYLGSWWLNTDTSDLFYLASLANREATWINVSSSMGGIMTLTADSGGAVSPDINGNINIIGDVTTVNIVGDPITNTLTVSADGSSLISSLTGNTGGAVFATAGNINIIGSGSISVAGNPGTSTLTISQSSSVANSFNTQSGTATPVLGVLNIIGATGVSTTGSGNTVNIVGSSSFTTSFITAPATGTAIPAAGVLTFASGTDEAISAAGSTVTFAGSGSSGGIPSYSTGTFVPGVTLDNGGSFASVTYSTQSGIYTQIGDLVFFKIILSFSFTVGVHGDVVLTGLPFTVSATYDEVITSHMPTLTAQNTTPLFRPTPKYVIIFAKFLPTTTTAPMYKSQDSGLISRLNDVDINAAISWGITGWYYKQ